MSAPAFDGSALLNAVAVIVVMVIIIAVAVYAEYFALALWESLEQDEFGDEP